MEERFRNQKKKYSSIFLDFWFLRQTHRDGISTCFLSCWSEQCSKHKAAVSMQIPQGCWLHPFISHSSCFWEKRQKMQIASAKSWVCAIRSLLRSLGRLALLKLLGQPRMVYLGSPSLKQWTAGDDALIASVYILSAPLLGNITAQDVDCTLAPAASWALNWIGFPLTNQPPSPRFNINWLEMLLTVPSGCINFLQIEFGLMRQETWNYSWHLLHTQNSHCNAFREAHSSRVVTEQGGEGGYVVTYPFPKDISKWLLTRVIFYIKHFFPAMQVFRSGWGSWH